MQATQTTTIGDREYSVTQLPAKRGLRLFNKLCRIVAPPAAKALAGNGGGLSLQAVLNADMGSVSAALGLLFEKLTEVEQEAIFKELLEGARFRDEASQKLLPLWEQFDVAFQGRLHEAYQVLGFALRVNFASFSDALKAAINAAMEKVAAAEPEKTSDPS